MVFRRYFLVLGGDRETQKLGKRIDALDIEDGAGVSRGTNTVVIDLLGSVEETIERIQEIQKKVRKVNHGREFSSFLTKRKKNLKDWRNIERTGWLHHRNK